MSSHAIGSAPLTTAATGTTAAASPQLAATGTITRPTTGYNRLPVEAAAGEFDQIGAAVRSAATPGTGGLESDAYRAQRGSLLTKIGPLLATTDPAIRTKVEQTLQRADARGSFRASEVARLVVQVEGSAAGLPASYLHAADEAQDLAEAIEQDIDDAMTRVSQMLESEGASMDQLMPLLELVNQVLAALEQLQTRLRENYDLARTDPAAAETKLRAGLGGDVTTPAAAPASR
jgi:hypothetical protein